MDRGESRTARVFAGMALAIGMLCAGAVIYAISQYFENGRLEELHQLQAKGWARAANSSGTQLAEEKNAGCGMLLDALRDSACISSADLRICGAKNSRLQIICTHVGIRVELIQGYFSWGREGKVSEKRAVVDLGDWALSSSDGSFISARIRADKTFQISLHHGELQMIAEEQSRQVKAPYSLESDSTTGTKQIFYFVEELRLAKELFGER